MAVRGGNSRHLLWCKSSWVDAEGSSEKNQKLSKLERSTLLSQTSSCQTNSKHNSPENFKKHVSKSMVYLVLRYVDSVPKNCPRDTFFAWGSGQWSAVPEVLGFIGRQHSVKSEGWNVIDRSVCRKWWKPADVLINTWIERYDGQ